MTAISLTNISGAENGNAAPLSPTSRREPGGDARKAEIRKAAVEFQAIFVEMMLKSMRETTKQDRLTGGGHGEDIYGSLLDREYAAAISRRGNLGLAEMIEGQMLNQEHGAVRPANNPGTGTTDKSNIEVSHEN